MSRTLAHLASRTRRGSVSLMFAGMAIPLVLATALAVDYSFWVDAKSQLDVAADAGAIHAVRVASAEFVAGVPTQQALDDGTAAGLQWFNAQLGTITSASLASNGVTVPEVQYDANSGTFTETISYNGTVATNVGAAITAIASWPIIGSSTAKIAANSYSEFEVLVDNSSSMLIGATPADIIAIEQLTVCAPTATVDTRGFGEYAWNYPNGIGYGANQTVPVASPISGSCSGKFTGGSAQCPYPQGMTANPAGMASVDSAGFCPTGTGHPDGQKRIDPNTKLIGNVPNAPCGFACHESATNDAWSLVQSYNKGPGAGQPIQLRFDVIQNAMATMVGTISAAAKIPNQFSIGVFQFNSGVTRVHPLLTCTQTDGSCENGEDSVTPIADTNFTQAATDIKAIATPIVPDIPNTDFPGAATYLAGVLTPAGNGGSPTSRLKNMFIITDGMQDFQPSGQGRTIGPMTKVSPEAYCSQLKSLGYNIYVLYTPYYPLPNPFYLDSGPRTYVEPTVPPAATNPVIAALKACATTPSQFYQAKDTASINTALSLMVQSALASPGGFTD